MIKRAIIITLILNSLILIGVPAGHGYGIMIMFEFISIPSLIRNGINFNDNYPFNSLVLLGLVSLHGKVVLIISLCYKSVTDRKILIYSGLGLLLSSFIGVVLGAWNYDTFLLAVTFGSAIPFLMYFGRVIFLMNRKASTPKLKAD